jgi:hypothetical protein
MRLKQRFRNRFKEGLFSRRKTLLQTIPEDFPTTVAGVLPD